MSKESFCYPVKVLENDRVKLVPFDPELHLQDLLNGVAVDEANIARYCLFGPFETKAEALELYNFYFKGSTTEFLYAVMVKTSPDGKEELGGTIGFVESKPTHLSTEVGGILTVPKFQGTFVTKNAVGLLLKYALDKAPDGLGLRRVQWQTHELNAASIGIAKRMGFTWEGRLRWERRLPHGKQGSDTVPEGEKPGRHSVMLAICWDDWIEKREDIMKLMEK